MGILVLRLLQIADALGGLPGLLFLAALLLWLWLTDPGN
jgi:hypothetical protein